jgi:hypothetical protein
MILDTILFGNTLLQQAGQFWISEDTVRALAFPRAKASHEKSGVLAVSEKQSGSSLQRVALINEYLILKKI